MANSRCVVVGIVLLGVIAGAVAWWFRYQQTHRCLLFWGAEQSQIIRAPDKVEYWELRRVEGNADLPEEMMIAVSDVSYTIRRRVDVSHVAGVLHVRDALLTDETFRWEEKQAGETAPPDTFDALVFYGDNQRIVVLFDPSTWRMWAPPRRDVLDASPKAALWKRWFAERKQER